MSLHASEGAEVSGVVASQRLQRIVHGGGVQRAALEVPAHRREEGVRRLSVVDGVAARPPHPAPSTSKVTAAQVQGWWEKQFVLPVSAGTGGALAGTSRISQTSLALSNDTAPAHRKIAL